MKLELTAQQKEARTEARTFVQEQIIPYADQFDREEEIPTTLIRKLGQLRPNR